MAKEKEDNVVYVGQKSPLKYATAVTTLFSRGHDEVKIKARGRSISTAVDAEEIVTNKFLEEAEVKDISTNTVQLEGEEGGEVNVSQISITLTR